MPRHERYAATLRRGALVAIAVLSFAAVSCTAPPNVGVKSAAFTDYDPQRDAFANPARLYEPFPMDAPERVDQATTIVRHDFGQPSTLNPLFPSGAASAWDLYLMLFEWIVVRHDDPTGYDWNSNVVLGVELSEDLRSVTLTLNPELRWHDGEPWTAHDIAFSLEVLKDSRVPINFFGPTRELVSSAVALDDHRVRFTYADVLAPNLRLESLSFPIVPRHVLGSPKEREHDPTLRSSPFYNRYGREGLIGSGPYRFVEWRTNDRIVVERWNEHYLFERAPPAAKRVIVKFQADRNLAYLQFLSGEFDQIYVDARIYATQARGETFEARGLKAHHTSAFVSTILWNMDGSNPFFSDANVRRAMAHAYDADTVLERVGHGLYPRAYGYMPPGRFDYDPSIAENPYNYDLERAASLLDEAGWHTDEDDGWRYKSIDGERTRFTFELAYNAGMTYVPPTLDILRDDLRRLGVEMITRAYESASLSQKRLQHEFQASWLIGGTTNDPNTLINQLTTDAYHGGRNSGGYSNPRVDALFLEGAREQNPEVRAEIYREIHREVYRDQPCLFLFHISFLWVFSNDIRGVELGPMGTVLLFPTPPEGWPARLGPGWWRER